MCDAKTIADRWFLKIRLAKNGACDPRHIVKARDDRIERLAWSGAQCDRDLLKTVLRKCDNANFLYVAGKRQ